MAWRLEPAPETVRTAPKAFRNPHDPIWRDGTALLRSRALRKYVRTTDLTPIRLAGGHGAFGAVLWRWALDHDYINEYGRADWGALRRDGVIT